MPLPQPEEQSGPPGEEKVPTPRRDRALVLAGFGALSLGLFVVGIAARHYSAWATVFGVGAGLGCLRQVFHYLEEWDEEDRHEASRAMRPVKPQKLLDEPGLVTVPGQFDALKPRKSQPPTSP